MKKILTISVCLIIVCSFLLIGNTRADAMNNESAAMLAGAIALFGRPILNSIANDVFYILSTCLLLFVFYLPLSC
jgi:hypothetical protein